MILISFYFRSGSAACITKFSTCLLQRIEKREQNILCCHSFAGSICEEQIMLFIMIFLVKYKRMKKEVKLGLLLLLFHPFLNPGHACIAKLDVTWAF